MSGETLAADNDALDPRSLHPHHTGTPETLSYRVHAGYYSPGADSFQVVSYWHDVPLHPRIKGVGANEPDPESECFHFVCEIPKHTRAKMEVRIDEPWTPIAQDVTMKGGGVPALRYLASRIPWNYGMIPQTLEDPAHCWNLPALEGLPGDGDPLDAVEIGAGRALRCGYVYRVKVLGAFALIDGDELDWKLITIRTDDPAAAGLRDISDVDAVFPGELRRIHDWFRDYKVADGKGRNRFGCEGQPVSREFAVAEVIGETHRAYMRRFVPAAADAADDDA